MTQEQINRLQYTVEATYAADPSGMERVYGSKEDMVATLKTTISQSGATGKVYAEDLRKQLAEIAKKTK